MVACGGVAACGAGVATHGLAELAVKGVICACFLVVYLVQEGATMSGWCRGAAGLQMQKCIYSLWCVCVTTFIYVVEFANTVLSFNKNQLH